MSKFYEWLKESTSRAGAVGAPAAGAFVMAHALTDSFPDILAFSVLLLLGEFAVLYASYLHHQERHP
ncbi:MAG: hypothetical protein M3N00_08750 [Actinomycetota bacterium]|nr:hypothetical protein [Actinomycetota bacterium]